MTRAYAPNPGFAWNPLRAHRNAQCPCGSGEKVKRCHGVEDLVKGEEAVFAHAGALTLEGKGDLALRLIEEFEAQKLIVNGTEQLPAPRPRPSWWARLVAWVRRR